MKYSIGIDFGSVSCRGVLYCLDSEEISKTEVFEYPNLIIEEELHGVKLKKDMVLQDPNDYISGLEFIVKKLTENLTDGEIKFIGIDFTSSTVLPVTANYELYCNKNEYKENPHAYAKMWKSHSAGIEAQTIYDVLKNHSILDFYGKNISSEWLYPKLLEIVNEDENFFDQMELFMEAGDWLVSRLTNQLIRSNCMAGFKGLLAHKALSDEELTSIHPKFSGIYDSKLKGEYKAVGEVAGKLSEEYAKRLGLTSDVDVAVCVIDAHASLLADCENRNGTMHIILGTSACHIVLHEEKVLLPGIAGVVENGILPGYFAYEAGQSAVGDLFNSFVNQILPEKIINKAIEKDCSVFELLNLEAKKQMNKEHGLVMLDWHNGNRTPYMNADLSGVTFGETLKTTYVDRYLAMIESTAFGTKQIIDLFENNNMPIDRIVFSGGIPKKNDLLMQIFANVIEREIEVLQQDEIAAVGAARLLKRINSNNKNDVISYFPNGRSYKEAYQFYKKMNNLLANDDEFINLGRRRGVLTYGQ